VGESVISKIEVTLGPGVCDPLLSSSISTTRLAFVSSKNEGSANGATVMEFPVMAGEVGCTTIGGTDVTVTVCGGAAFFRGVLGPVFPRAGDAGRIRVFIIDVFTVALGGGRVMVGGFCGNGTNSVESWD